jgi:hypothetical protein
MDVINPEQVRIPTPYYSVSLFGSALLTFRHLRLV